MDETHIRTPDQRLRVFISSSIVELAAERTVVRDAVAALRLTPVLFELGARPHPPRELYRAYLDQSHIFVGVYWESYGWIAPDASVSGLEEEFVLAADHPKLIYIKEPAPNRDPRLVSLLQRIRHNEQLSYRKFSLADELRELVQNDLAVLLAERVEATMRPPSAGARPPTGPRFDNLLAPATSFVGREAELAALRELVLRADVRLVTLLGPGGVGKTRLAIEAGRALRDSFEHGACFVSLASVSDPALVVPTIAHALGLNDIAGGDIVGRLNAFLRDKHVLLILDNLEQVTAAGPAIAGLLAGAPRLELLVTSREPLRIRGEHEFIVAPLVSPNDAGTANLSELQNSAAARLFADRVAAVKPGWQLDANNAPDVARIVRQLDGLPLAIELAAARARRMSLESLSTRLGRALNVLTDGPRDLPARHQTLRATIDWSYALLTASEQQTFERAGVFAGSFEASVAAQVVGDEVLTSDEVMDSLASLADKSLLRFEPTDDAERYAMPPTIREFALEKLQTRGEGETIRRRHALAFLALAERAAPKLKMREQREWLARLFRDLDNVRAALAWCAESKSVQEGLRLGAALWYFWFIRGYADEGERSLSQMLALGASQAEPGLRARAQFAVGALTWAQGEFAEASRLLLSTPELFRAAHDEAGLALAHTGAGMALGYQRDFAAAETSMAAGYALARELGDTWAAAYARTEQGRLALARGQPREGIAALQDGLAFFQEAGDRSGMVQAMESLALALVLAGEFPRAAALVSFGLDVSQELEQPAFTAYCLEIAAILAAVSGQHEHVAILAGAAETLRASTGTRMTPSESALYDSHLETARQALGPAAFVAARENGRRLSRADAIALASSGTLDVLTNVASPS